MAEMIASGMSELSLATADSNIMLNVRGCRVPCSAIIARKMSLGSKHTDDQGLISLDLDPILVAAVIKYLSTGHLHSLLPSTTSDSPISALQQLGVQLQLPSLQHISATLEQSIESVTATDSHAGKPVASWDAAAALILGIQNGTFPENSGPGSSTDSSSAYGDAGEVYAALQLVATHPGTFNSRIIRWAVDTAKQHAPFLSQAQIEALESSSKDAADAAGRVLAGPSSSNSFDVESDEMYSAKSSSDYYDAASE